MQTHIKTVKNMTIETTFEENNPKTAAGVEITTDLVEDEGPQVDEDGKLWATEVNEEGKLDLTLIFPSEGGRL
jgi:hypothetical protein